MDRSTLQRKSVDDLREIAKQLDLTGTTRLRKAELIDAIVGEIDGNGDNADGGDEGHDQGRNGDGGQRRREEVIERRRSRSRNRTEEDGGDEASNDEASNDEPSDDEAGDDDRGSSSADSSDEGSEDGATGRGRSRDRRRRGKGRGDLDGLEEREGVLDLLPEGYGFLRTTGYVSGPKDVYVSQSYVRRFNLRRGDLLGGPVRFNKGNDKFPALARLETCEGETVENEHDPVLRERPDFADLDPRFPEEQLLLGDLEGASPVLAAVDVFAPIGYGQRALLLTPPTADSGALVRALADAVLDASPDVELFVALIDARPEDIGEAERSLDAEVVGSALDAPPEDHVAAAELVVERAKRLAERGDDVVVLLDSLTQLGRAYNLAGSSSGRSLPGGIDSGAIAPLKQLFGAARNLDGDGSLTVLAVAGTDPESATDRTILDHLRGAGNAELRFDPTLGTDGELPALDVQRSGTRRVEAVVGADDAREAAAARRALAALAPADAWRVVADVLADGGDAAAVLAAAEDARDA